LSSPHLSIVDYDRREREARVLATYPALRAFTPVSFQQASFPTRVVEEYELRRYADIMCELKSRSAHLEDRAYSDAEARLILELSTRIELLTGRLFGKPVRPLMCMFPPMPLIRMVEHFANAIGRRLIVLEIGPGAMHLGAYLRLLGHQYTCMEVCQALYLWQNRLLMDLSPDLSE
jgi:hypothetical protein